MKVTFKFQLSHVINSHLLYSMISKSQSQVTENAQFIMLFNLIRRFPLFAHLLSPPYKRKAQSLDEEQAKEYVL